jgi:hypothetical protein
MVDYTTCDKKGFLLVIRTPGRRRNVIAFAGVCVLSFVVIMSTLGATGVFKNESAPAEVNDVTESDGNVTVRRLLPLCMRCVLFSDLSTDHMQFFSGNAGSHSEHNISDVQPYRRSDTDVQPYRRTDRNSHRRTHDDINC